MIFKVHFFFIFITLACLQCIFAAHTVQSQNTCRSYLVRSDVLHKFSKEEKTKLEAAATMWVDLMGKTDFQSQQAKGELNTSIENLIAKKQLNKNEKDLFKDWFKERIQYYIKSKKQSLLDDSKKAQDHAQQLEKQKTDHLLMVEAKKIKKILNKYNAKNLSEAFLAADKFEQDRFRSGASSFKKDIMFILDRYEQLEITDLIFRKMIQYDHLPAIDYFIRKKINLNSRTFVHMGNSPLHIAAEYNTNPKIIQLLIDSNDIEHINNRGSGSKTALHLAAASNPNPDILKVLIDAGADAFLKDSGMTALHHVVSYCTPSIETLQLLIDVKQGALLKTPSDEGELPLHIAARLGSREVVEFLIQADHGAQLNSKSGENSRNGKNKKSTPLHFAISNSIEILKALLDAGADPTLLNSKNHTPIDELMVLPLQRRESAQEVQQKIELLYEATEKWKRMHPP